MRHHLRRLLRHGRDADARLRQRWASLLLRGLRIDEIRRGDSLINRPPQEPLPIPSQREFRAVWAILYTIYLTKRLIQTVYNRQTPRTAAGWRYWKRNIDTHFVLNLPVWAQPRHEHVDMGWYWAHRHHHRLTSANLLLLRQRSAQLRHRPLISVVVPVYNTPAAWLDRLVASIVNQVYDHWELILVDDGSTSEETSETLSRLAFSENRITVDRLHANQGVAAASNRALELAAGDFVAFVDHDDELLPDALFWIADALDRDPFLDLIYTDEELVRCDGVAAYPHFKPAFSPEMLTAFNYICHLLVIRRSLVEKVGRFRVGTDGVQDYDLILRCIEQTSRVGHIPRVLYRWHVVPHSMSRTINKATAELARSSTLDHPTARVVQGHLDRIGLPATAVPVDGWVKPAFPPIDNGKVSILIPTRDQPKRLKRCLRSIERLTDYPNYEIVVIDTGSKLKATERLLKKVATAHRVLSIPNGPDGFNFSRVNNEAARQVDGRYLLFLNDDTEVLTHGWLSAMVGYATRPGVGAVGARLLFPGRYNQHAGVVVGAMGFGPWHALVGIPADMNNYLGYLTFPHNCLAATAACLLTPRELFLSLGGFDETDFGVGYNDVDYGLRLHAAGYRTAYAPQAELMHDEGASRGRGINPHELAALRRKYPTVDDPYWNPNYSRETPHFVVSPRRRAIGALAEPPRVLAVSPVPDHQQRFSMAEDLLARLAARDSCRPLWFPVTPELAADPDRLAAALEPRIQSVRPDVVFVDGHGLVGAVEAAHRARVPSIWHHAELLALHPSGGHADSARLLRVARGLTFPYQVTFSNLHSLAWAVRTKPLGSFVGMDAVLFDPAPPATQVNEWRAAVRRQYGIGEQAVVIAAIGSMVPSGSNDSDTAREALLDEWRCVLKAFKRLARSSMPFRSTTPELFLFLVADRADCRVANKLHRPLRSLERQAALVVNADTGPLLAAADIVVNHAVTELRSRTALRSLAFGKPMIGTEEARRADLFSHGVNGLFFPAFDARKLATQMHTLWQDAAYRQKLAEASRAWLDCRASPGFMLDQWASLFAEAAELAERPSGLSLLHDGWDLEVGLVPRLPTALRC